jgi:hypothetical protein
MYVLHEHVLVKITTCWAFTVYSGTRLALSVNHYECISAHVLLVLSVTVVSITALLVTVLSTSLLSVSVIRFSIVSYYVCQLLCSQLLQVQLL